jgi:hypothetical protein
MKSIHKRNVRNNQKEKETVQTQDEREMAALLVLHDKNPSKLVQV